MEKLILGREETMKGCCRISGKSGMEYMEMEITTSREAEVNNFNGINLGGERN